MSSVNSEAEEKSKEQEGKPQRGAAPGRAVGDDGKRKKDEKSDHFSVRFRFEAGISFQQCNNEFIGRADRAGFPQMVYLAS